MIQGRIIPPNGLEALYGLKNGKKKPIQETHTTMKNIRYIIFLSICLILMTSCRTTKTIEVPVEVPVIKTEYKTKTDSILIHDSVFHTIYREADTVYSQLIKYRYKYLVKRDTILRQDTIYKTKTLTNTVEKCVKYVPWYLKSLALIGAAALLLLGIKLKFKLL